MQTATSVTTVSRTVCDLLSEAGAPLVCGMPGGGSNLDLIEACDVSGIPFLPTQGESASVMLAATLSDLSGRITASVATLGPGVTNAINGVANAWLDRLPVLFVSDCLPEGAGPLALRQKVDHAALLAPITKRSYRLTRANAARSVREAIELALRPPRGPVHLDLSAEVAGQPPGRSVSPRGRKSGRGVPEALLEAAAARLAKARRPLLVAGLEVRTGEIARELVALAEALEAPVMTTYRGKGAIPADHPLAAGIFTHAKVEQELLAEADLIVGVGLDPVELLTRPWPYRERTVSLREALHPDEPESGRTTVAGPLVETLRGVGERIACSRVLADWASHAAAFDARVRRDLAARLGTGVKRGLSPATVVQVARDLAPREAVAVVDSGAHMFPASYFWDAYRPRSYLCSGGLATMGFALPGALAASLHAPDHPVVSLTGDGGFLMNLPDLATAAELGAHVVSVVFADRSLSLIRLKQEERGLGGGHLDVAGVDWAGVAQKFGLGGYTATTTAQLERSLSHALEDRRPSVVSVAVDPANYREASRLLRG